MFAENYRIDSVLTVSLPNDRAGRVLNMTNRGSAALIFTLSGRLLFTDAYARTEVCAGHSVYIPRGYDYRNECIETAASIMFNLLDRCGPERLTPFAQPHTGQVMEVFSTVQSLFAAAKPGYMQQILSEMYRLTVQIENAADTGGSLLRPLIDFMEQHYAEPKLELSSIAEAAHISVVYMNKLFQREYGLPPFRYLTGIRMRRARALLWEHRRVLEVARLVGYADVYQFSRAYKNYFGYAPSNEFRYLRG